MHSCGEKQARKTVVLHIKSTANAKPIYPQKYSTGFIIIFIKRITKISLEADSRRGDRTTTLQKARPAQCATQVCEVFLLEPTQVLPTWWHATKDLRWCAVELRTVRVL